MTIITVSGGRLMSNTGSTGSEPAPKQSRAAELAGDMDLLVGEFGIRAVREALNMIEALAGCQKPKGEDT